MDSRATVINQLYEPPIASKQVLKRAAEIFPDRQQMEVNPLQSLSTVLAQSLITKDKNAIKELLVNANTVVIKNTINELEVSKVSILMESIENLLLSESRNLKNIRVISLWLGELLKKNIGHIINSPELQVQARKIRVLLQNRISIVGKLQELNARVAYRECPTEEPLEFQPRFHYIEDEKEIDQDQEQDPQNQDQEKMSDIGESDMKAFAEMGMEDFDI